MYCIILHFIKLYYLVFGCTVLQYCMGLAVTSIYCIVFDAIALCCMVLHPCYNLCGNIFIYCTVLTYCTVLYGNVGQCMVFLQYCITHTLLYNHVLHNLLLYYIVLHYIVLYGIVRHCSVICAIVLCDIVYHTMQCSTSEYKTIQ